MLAEALKDPLVVALPLLLKRSMPVAVVPTAGLEPRPPEVIIKEFE